MQNRVIATLGFGGALFAGAMLAACGGSGSAGGSSSALPATQSGGSASGPAAKASTNITVRIDRQSPAWPACEGVTGSSKRRDYISTCAKGLQVAVSTTGANATTRTIYADLSTNSPLCTPGTVGTVETCALSVPTLATSETIVATEVDQTPTSESGGYGTGFPTGSNVLAASSMPVTTIPGAVTNLALGLDPVAAYFAVCGHLTSGETHNFEEDTLPAPSPPATPLPARIVFTSGVGTTSPVPQIGVEFTDADHGYVDTDLTPVPFADVNGSPTPISVVSSSSSVTVAPIPNPSITALPAPSYSMTASIPDDSYEWGGGDPAGAFVIGVKLLAGLTTPQTITISNNLKATSPFKGTGIGRTYSNDLVINIVPISVSSTTATVGVTEDTTASVTGSDDLAYNGMGAESVWSADDGKCFDATTSTQEDASVTSSGSISTSTWLQTFTITPMNPGSCTFYLYDLDTQVITAPVTVTVNP